MDIKGTRQLISRVREDVDLLRRIIEKETSDARMLIDADVHQELSDDLLAIGNDVATAEVKWRYFGLVGFARKKMAVTK